MTVTEGQLISDGTAVWKVKKIGSEVPAGTMQMFAGNTIPAGWLLCDGSAVSRADYAKLFSAIGTTWGAGDGSTTFNLPNSIGRFAEGAGNAGGYKEAGLPNIEGGFFIRKPSSASVILQPSGGAFKIGTRSTTDLNITLGSTNVTHQQIDFDASQSNSIYGNSLTVQPNSFTVRYIIKY